LYSFLQLICEDSIEHLDLKEFPVSTVKTVLRYIYTGQLPDQMDVNLMDFDNIYKLADRLVMF